MSEGKCKREWRYIYKQLGVKGLFELANNTAGKTINMLADIITSILP